MILLSFSILTAISQNKEKVMINKDGSFNAYFFVDTLYFDKEAVILSRNDGHLYLLSDSCMLDNLKKTDKIMCMENTYLLHRSLWDFIGYIITELDTSYLLKLSLDERTYHLTVSKKSKSYFRMKYDTKPKGYYLFLIKGKTYNYITYERSIDVFSGPVYFPDENAYYKLAIPFW